MNKIKKLLAVLAVIMMVGVILSPVRTYAAGEETAVEESADSSTSAKAWAAGIAIAFAAGAGAIGMGMVVSKSTESIARQPEAEGKIRTTMMLGLVFVETAIIYALIVVILIIFVL